MQALVSDGKLREREFQFHTFCYNNYIKDYRYENDNIMESGDENLVKVMEFVKSNIIDGHRSCSMDVLVEINGQDPTDQKKRSHLKDKLQSHFPDELLL